MPMRCPLCQFSHRASEPCGKDSIPASLPAATIASGPPSAKEFLRLRKLANSPAGAAEPPSPSFTSPPKFDPITWKRNYQREYMVKWRAARKEKEQGK